MTEPSDKSGIRVEINGKSIDLNDLQSMQGMQTLGMMPRRSRGCGCLGAVLILGFILVMAVGVLLPLATVMGLPVNIQDMISRFVPNAGQNSTLFAQGPEQRPLENAAAFDPMASYEEALSFAGEGAQLVSLRVNQVRADGTLDLTATYTPSPSVEYVFVREVPRPENAPPPGAPGSTGSTFYEEITVFAERPGDRRQVIETGAALGRRYTYITEGWRREIDPPAADRYDILTAPTCSLRAFWEEALRQDAPADGVALVRYDEDGYSFSVSGFVSLQYTTDCTLDS